VLVSRDVQKPICTKFMNLVEFVNSYINLKMSNVLSVSTPLSVSVSVCVSVCG